MQDIRNAILRALAADHPQTIRQLFYRLVSAGVIVKTDQEYQRTVCRLCAAMRRSGDLPYGWLADRTRMVRRPRSFGSAEEALRNCAQTYRQRLWDGAVVVPEVWCEKDAITGVLIEETWSWDVALMSCRGYPSMSFLYAAAEAIHARAEEDQQTAIYYFGDHDPSGTDIDRFVPVGIGEALLQLADVDDAEPGDAIEAFWDVATFLRVAVLPSQITSMNLQTRPTKRHKHDYRARSFVGNSVEVDAIPAQTLRALTAGCIEQHVDQHELEVLRVFEDEERAGLEALVDGWHQKPSA
jgi:hypothetical protein